MRNWSNLYPKPAVCKSHRKAHFLKGTVSISNNQVKTVCNPQRGAMPWVTTVKNSFTICSRLVFSTQTDVCFHFFQYCILDYEGQSQIGYFHSLPTSTGYRISTSDKPLQCCIQKYYLIKTVITETSKSDKQDVGNLWLLRAKVCINILCSTDSQKRPNSLR